MQAKGILRRLVPPEIKRFAPFAADAVARRAVEVQAEMESMASGEFHGPVEPCKGETVFIDAKGVAILHPERVRERQPHKIETPVSDPPKIALLECLGAVGRVHLQQIKTAPTGQGVTGCHGQVVACNLG